MHTQLVALSETKWRLKKCTLQLNNYKKKNVKNSPKNTLNKGFVRKGQTQSEQISPAVIKFHTYIIFVFERKAIKNKTLNFVLHLSCLTFQTFWNHNTINITKRKPLQFHLYANYEKLESLET